MQDTVNDLELFYENINFDLVDPLQKPSPLGTINLKYFYPLSTEAREKESGSDEAQILFESAVGGHKRVYKSRLLSDGRLLALAFMKDSEDLNEVEAFIREATIAKSLKHKNIVEVYDCGIDQNYGPYMVMPWIEGGTLHEILKNLRNGIDDYVTQFTLSRLLKIFREICSAVSYAHEKDVIHLDLKPENIFVNYLSRKALLTDWGLAQSFRPIRSDIDPVMQLNEHPGFLRGTPGYMSPEQILNCHVDRRTDVYQLGGILYAIIFHHCPVAGENVEEVLTKTLNGEIYVDDLSDEIMPYVGICKKALEINPDMRYTEVKEIIDELDRIDTSRKKHALSKRAVSRKLLVLSSLLCIAVLTLSVLVFSSISAEKSKTDYIVESEEVVPQLDILAELKNFDNKSTKVVKSPVPQWYLYLESRLNDKMSENLGWQKEDLERYFEFINSAGSAK